MLILTTAPHNAPDMWPKATIWERIVASDPRILAELIFLPPAMIWAGSIVLLWIARGFRWPRTRASLLPFGVLAFFLSLNVIKAAYPNDLLCGETARTSEEAFDAAIRYMRERMPHSRAIPPDKEIRLYRLQHEKSWAATRARGSLFSSAYWSVHVELPSPADGGCVFEHWLYVYECGGASWKGTTPAEEGPSPRNCR
jgi:hypothetical protein